TARAVEAGKTGGLRVAATAADPITGVDEAEGRRGARLDTLGFAPEHAGAAHRDSTGSPRAGVATGEVGAPGPAPLAVRHCPFLELAADHQEIVCPVHLGLMRGALEAWGAPVRADALEPFAEPDRCLVHLST